jgi:hypothetical protein
VVTLAIDRAIDLPKKSRGMLPILIVLFLISYGLMSMLVVEQGRTIETQRGLIHDLLSDSTQLSAMKAKEILRERVATTLKGKAGTQTTPQASQQDGARKKNTAKSQRPALQKPPKSTADTADARRIPLTI